MPKSKPSVDVLVFDSGVGGLSILNAIRFRAPELSYAFLGDNAGLPYGDKSESWLIDRVPHIISKFLNSVDCQALVIACNTASTIVLPPLRAKFSFPIIGVVPAIKPAAAQSQTKVLGLLATPATIARPYTDSLVQEFAADCEVVRIGSSRLVMIAEEKMRGVPVNPAELKRIVEPFLQKNPDVVVLGCTHLPLIRDELEALMPGTRFIDSGDAIANRVLHFNLTPNGTSSESGNAYFTKEDIEPEHLKVFGLGKVSFLNI